MFELTEMKNYLQNISVKVYLTTIDDDHERAPSRAEINRIKVLVKCESPKKLVIKLNRLTESEINKYTMPSSTFVEHNLIVSVPNREEKNATGASVDRSICRDQKLRVSEPSNEPAAKAPSTIATEGNHHKRKGDQIITRITRSKRRKLEDCTIASSNGSVEEDELNPGNEQAISSSNAAPVNMTVARIPFVIGEVVWAKIRGWKHWPAKILSISPRQIEVEWFNDYRTTKIFRSQIYKFGPNFQMFAENFDSTVGLREAAEEALLHVMRVRGLK